MRKSEKGGFSETVAAAPVAEGVRSPYFSANHSIISPLCPV